MKERRIVVTGIGVLSAIGNNLNEYWTNLINGVSGAAPITLIDTTKLKTKFACEIKGFDPNNYVDRKETKRLDRFSQIAIAASIEAVADSGIQNNPLVDKDRVGVIVASGIGGLSSLYNEINENVNVQEYYRYSPFFIPKMILDIASGHISMRYGFRGPNFAVVSACASSTHGIMVAADNIKLGRADIILAGGSEAVIEICGISGFNSMKALSERNDDYTTASRPYDKTRDGFVMGEAAGILVLEEYEHAKRRGAKIYCEYIGGGATADAYHLTAPHPEGLGAKNVMISALAEAGIKTADVDYINSHGTSTPLGDIAEVKAIQEVFGEHIYNLNISSTKSMTGHCLGAAGAIEAIACIKAIQENKIPPTINHQVIDESFDHKINFTFNKFQEREVNVAISNTFGFGGHNSCVVFRKIPQ